MTPGTKLGSYEIVALIGAGGMGEVYRARDTKLKREVALKVLPEAFASDPERMARFQREAEVLASLNHPNIAQIYGVEDRALVMELVEGESPKGPMPFDEAWKIASQIAAGLEFAHDKGIVHRDLKPANIKITPDGIVKLLDFGLAKAFTAPAAMSGNPDNSPTLTLGATQLGVILGTAAYMAPEQAKGKAVDKRADIWSFGVVLYELVTGERLFTGDDVSETLADVLKKQPDLEKAPTQARRLLRECLQKDLRERLRDIGDAKRLLIEEARSTQLPAVVPTPSPSRLAISATAAALVLALALAALAFMHFRETPPQTRTLRYTIAMPRNAFVPSFAVSPDGRYIVLAAAQNGKPQLWLRSLDALEFQPMPGTDGAFNPFWSPDSRFIGFGAEGKLKKIAVTGGPAQSLCDISGFPTGSWNREEVIIFSFGENGVQRVSAGGGVPVKIGNPVRFPSLPVFLPDGRHFLYTLPLAGNEGAGIFVASLDGKENRRLLPDVSSVIFVPAAGDGSPKLGYLLFLRENTLMAQPFDARALQLSGDVFPVAEAVGFTGGISAPISASETGVLVYRTGGLIGNGGQILWQDRAGKILGPAVEQGNVADPALSPDERTMVFTRLNASFRDIWLRDLIRGTDRRFTFGPEVSFQALWSPKGDRIAYRSNRTGVPGDIYEKPVDGSGQEELLLTTRNLKVPNQWSRDGKFIVYYELGARTQRDVWVLPVDDRGKATGKPIPVVQTPFNDIDGQLSPDSRWMAYVSDESGQNEIYVRPFPVAEGIWKISTAGGVMPRWRGDGKELLYISRDKRMTAVPVLRAQPPDGSGGKPFFEPGTPVTLFDVNLANPDSAVYQYDVTGDGKRFLVNTSAGPAEAAAPLTVVMNWQAGLRK
jgi:Tol biopolymer transport system component